MEPSAILDLIRSDAIAKQFAVAGNDSACAARCAVIAPTVRRPVPARDIKLAAMLNGYWARMALALESSETPKETRGLCISFRDWLDDPKVEREVDFDLVQVQQMLGGAVAAGLLSVDELNALDAMANRPQSFTVEDVSAALLAVRPDGRVGEFD